MSRLRLAALTLVIAGALAVLGGVFFIYAGAYDAAALSQHSRITNWLLHTVALNSIGRRARDVKVPDLSDPAKAVRGLGLYRQNCLQCHGAPGEAPADFAMGLMPGAPPMVQVAREWPAKEIYWVVSNGIKMTAMPAWDFRMTESELWDVVAFVETMPKLSPTNYRAQVAAYTVSPEPKIAATLGPADAQRGRMALAQYACTSCHIIPGVVAPAGRVGPTLAGMGARSILAGVLANTRENTIEWIRHPQQVKPGNAMPDMGVTIEDARCIAAYLGTLH